MKYISLFFALFCLALSMPAYARGHGGGHGGHGGGHSGAHSGMHSGGGYSGSGNNHASGVSNTRRSNTKSIITRSTSPTVIAANHARTARPLVAQAATTAPVAGAASGRGTGTTENNSVYPGFYNNTSYNNSSYNNSYYYYNPYYYASPYAYDPYFGMWSMGFGLMYSPNYYPTSSPTYANNQSNEQLSRQPMDGFVVFYNDTLSGAVTVANRAISLETTDSGRDYDYKFHQKDPGLQYVTVYNDDDKQLNLVRLKDDPKKLWRVIHTGKLNIYDDRKGFIYKPADIDVKSLTVSYNGEVASLHSNSVNETKNWLADYVNRAYGLTLDPKKFNWNELLIYIDKLD